MPNLSLAKGTHNLTPGIDWLHSLISSGGLLLIISNILESQLHVYGWDMENNKLGILGVIFIIGGPYRG